MFKSFREIIDLWPSRVAMGRDVKRQSEVKKTLHPRIWYAHNRIAEKHFDALILAAADRGFEGVTYPVLAALLKQSPPPSRAAQSPAQE
jgi:hypothetical protein